MKRACFALLLASVLFSGMAQAEVCNIKVVSDASPDYSDMRSLVHSICSKWKTDKEKCWAMFYWNHIARRQTAPIIMHGLALSDPIRQFNDYGFTMCSTISGINNAIWEHMGLKHRYCDVSLHTICEVEYDGTWHMYDNSLSAYYTLCDGKTVASIADLGKELACEASGGKAELSHIVKYHCQHATSPLGYIEGADCARGLAGDTHYLKEYIKQRSYYYDWDFGHRYILNLKDGEVYTRFYHRLDDPKKPDTKFFVPNPPHEWDKPKDPESTNLRYRIRGNGVWTFKAPLSAEFSKTAHSFSNIAAAEGSGLQPEKAGEAAHVIFKIQSANVTTSMTIEAAFALKSADDSALLAISTDNGLHWQEVFKSDKAGEVPAKVELNREVNCTYETLIRIALNAKAAPADAVLKALNVQTITTVNSKTQPKLNLGKNTIYVGLGDQTESIVFWPELQRQQYKQHIFEEKNIKAEDKHPGYLAVVKCGDDTQEGYLIYKMDAPGDITQVTYGGRFYNRGKGAHSDLLHSFDGGKTWTKSWSLTDTEQPWDRIHYETIKAPAATRSVLFKYSLNKSGLYALRMEANYLPTDTAFKPIEVTYTWHEVQKDRTRTKRSHTQLVEQVPARYSINVAGADLPVMDSLAISLKGARADVKYGYSDDKDVGGEKFIGQWRSLGKVLSVGKPYTVSVPSGTQWGAGDPEGKKLTDGVVGPNFAGGTTPGTGLLWDAKSTPEIIVDLGKEENCGAFRVHLTAGYPWWDGGKGEVKDTIELLTSLDGQEYTSHGFFNFDILKKDLPVNFMYPDDESLTGYNFELIPAQAVKARHLKYKVTAKRTIVITEVQALEGIRYEPFDLRLALPDEKPEMK